MAKDVKEKSPQRSNKIILSRTLSLMFVCGIVAFVALGVRLYKLQIVDHEKYEQLAVEQQTQSTTVLASRGTIYDANGNILAMSATAYTVYISPYEIQYYGEDINLIAEKLSEILGVDYNGIIEKSEDTASWYKTIAKKIESDLADQVREFKSEYNLKGVHIEQDSKRYYPYGTLACHVLGFVGTDNDGLEGLELIYDSYLRGEDGNIVRLTTGEGTDMLFTNYEYYNDAIDGSDMALTLDVTIQNIAEKYLDQAIEDYDVQNGGACIVMDVNTGGILAMASVDNYDPNNYSAVSDEVQAQLDQITDETQKAEALKEAQYEQWRNKAVSDTYEPGSVFKIITLSMALEEGTATLDSSYYCGGSVSVLGRDDPVNCWKTAGHGSQTLTQAVQHSCNVAFVNIGLSVGAKPFYKYAEAFGLFEKTGVDLTGEAKGQWWSEDIFYDEDNLSQLAAASFGQTFTITPLQMITAVCAAANGGNLMEPYVVSKITSPDGEVVYEKGPTVIRRVISEETSEKVCSILEAVVGEEGGTGSNAYVAGYRIAGKTGTSEKVAQEAQGGEKDEYIVSFCGFAPADDPQIAILLILDTPNDSIGIYVSGGVMAAPVVGSIFSEVLPYMGIDPVYTEEEAKYTDVTMPKVISKSVEDAVAQLEELGLEVEIVGNGETVTDQLPASKAQIVYGTTVYIFADEAKPDNEVTVPNLYGLTAAEAKAALAERGLFLEISGAPPTNSNVVVSNQDVEGGAQVVYGSIIQVTLVNTGNLGRY